MLTESFMAWILWLKKIQYPQSKQNLELKNPYCCETPEVDFAQFD